LLSCSWTFLGWTMGGVPGGIRTRGCSPEHCPDSHAAPLIEKVVRSAGWNEKTKDRGRKESSVYETQWTVTREVLTFLKWWNNPSYSLK
jgi:hypothetical protein